MTRSGSLLVAGTTSDAGKSVVTTGLCRAFARRGREGRAVQGPEHVQQLDGAPPTAREIGRAQWVQALAARAEPEAAMNPVLLKPGSDRRSHVVVMGRPGGTIDAHESRGVRTRARRDAAFAAYDDLASRYDVVVCRGRRQPGRDQPARAATIVNMGLARHADLPDGGGR